MNTTNRQHTRDLYFLQRGGEMGEMIRSHNWDNSGLGAPETWSSTLKTAVSLMLENPFGIYIVWGKDYLQLYNDGFRPILGKDKHPQALGASSRETFAEIWPTIEPLFAQVLQGEAVSFNDFMVPLHRNGYTENCYFNFAYSPIRETDGTVAGILVTVIETTAKKIAEDSLKESEQKFRDIADNIPNLAWLADEKGKITWYNRQWHEYTGSSAETMENINWQDILDPVIFPDLLVRWQESLDTGTPFEMVFPMKGKDGIYRQFLTRMVPIKGEDGLIYRWLGTNTDVTQQIKAELDAKESEKRFRTMAEGTDLLVATADGDGNAQYFNQAWLDFTGRSMNSLVNYGWSDLLHEEDRDSFLQKYVAAFDKQQSWTAEFRVPNKDGEYRWLFTKAPARFRSDGSFAGYISSSIDITDRKEAEENLKKSELHLRSVIEGAPFPIGVYIGRELIIKMANQTILDIYGKGPGVIGKSYRAILPELDTQELFKQIDQVYDTGVPFHARNQPVDIEVNGKMVTTHFNYSFTPLLDDEGKVYGILNTGADVSDLNAAKQKLEQSEKNLRETILQAPVAMCLLKGEEFIVEIANDRMCELWGKSRPEVMHRPLLKGLPEIKDQGFDLLMKGVLDTGEAFVAEGVSVNLQRNGNIEKLFVNFVYAPYHETEGTVSGIMVVASDVTAQVVARQQIEEKVNERTKELAQANQDLQKTNAELAQFAYIASHDLQEPLRKITTFTQLLESRVRPHLDDAARNYIERINNSSVRMNNLIRDVLAYSEIAREVDVYSVVDLNEVISHILVDFELLIDEKQAQFEIAQMPAIEAIPLQMSQLFSNLIGNSLKFAKKDIPARISIKAETPAAGELDALNLDSGKKFVKIIVRDNGIGFNPEYEKKIFHIFQRLHRKSEYSGTGIGLAMCKKIALNHHGDLNAAGTSGNGAVFNVFLPIEQKQEH